MPIDIAAAHDFVATHARLLERRRLGLGTGPGDPTAGDSTAGDRTAGDPTAVLDALDGYRNPDGGYGWGLEPDLRSPESQPAAAHHAFEVLAEIAPATVGEATALCGWLDSVTLPDGGLPFALPVSSSAGNGPWWAAADPSVSSLQITSVTAMAALAVADHDAAVAGHRWLGRATAYCLRAIAEIDEPPFAYVLAFSVRFLDALHASRPDDAARGLEHLAPFVPASGTLTVQGGTAEEALRPLDLSPYPDTLSRSLLGADVIAADLERLAALQQDDGGWVVDYLKISPAGAMEWRGYATLRALEVLRRNSVVA
jgi:hypothetical protein